MFLCFRLPIRNPFWTELLWEMRSVCCTIMQRSMQTSTANNWTNCKHKSYLSGQNSSIAERFSFIIIPCLMESYKCGIHLLSDRWRGSNIMMVFRIILNMLNFLCSQPFCFHQKTCKIFALISYILLFSYIPIISIVYLKK